MKKIEELKESGFFKLTELQQIQFLREDGFFELSNEDKINFLEKVGLFYLDINDDPPSEPLKPGDIDYLRTSKASQLKRDAAMIAAKKFLDNLLNDKKLIIKDVKGLENMQSVTSGAIITCNHFNPFDCFAIEKVFRMSGQDKNKKMFKVIREGNYTNFPGLYGFFFKNCDTLPLSSMKSTMVNFLKSVDTILQRGDFILVYPEQSMWLDYKKIRPLKNGAFTFAAKNKVPVIPAFITLNDSDIIGDTGLPIQEYTIHIGTPIQPNSNLNVRENANIMRNLNYEFCKSTYENYYGISLEYDTINHLDLLDYVSSVLNF